MQCHSVHLCLYIHVPRKITRSNLNADIELKLDEHYYLNAGGYTVNFVITQFQAFMLVPFVVFY